MCVPPYPSFHFSHLVSPDDYTSVSMTLVPFTTQCPSQCINISIINNVILEPTEEFTARLTLIPASVTTINASRIIVDPPETTVQITNNDLSKYSSITTYWLVWHSQTKGYIVVMFIPHLYILECVISYNMSFIIMWALTTVNYLLTVRIRAQTTSSVLHSTVDFT